MRTAALLPTAFLLGSIAAANAQTSEQPAPPPPPPPSTTVTPEAPLPPGTRRPLLPSQSGESRDCRSAPATS